jgi:hypothetical protein
MRRGYGLLWLCVLVSVVFNESGHTHIVKPAFWNATVLNISRKIGAKVCCIRSEEGISRHTHLDN